MAGCDGADATGAVERGRGSLRPGAVRARPPPVGPRAGPEGARAGSHGSGGTRATASHTPPNQAAHPICKTPTGDDALRGGGVYMEGGGPPPGWVRCHLLGTSGAKAQGDRRARGSAFTGVLGMRWQGRAVELFPPPLCASHTHTHTGSTWCGVRGAGGFAVVPVPSKGTWPTWACQGRGHAARRAQGLEPAQAFPT